jgi:hypothetical protein
MSKPKRFTTTSKGLSVDDDVRDFDRITIPKNELLEDLGMFLFHMDMARTQLDASGLMPTKDEEAEIWNYAAGDLFKTLTTSGIVIIEGEVQ